MPLWSATQSIRYGVCCATWCTELTHIPNIFFFSVWIKSTIVIWLCFHHEVIRFRWSSSPDAKITFYYVDDGFSGLVLIWQVLASSGCVNSVSQMPLVLIPVHFDRDQMLRIPSCQRSIVLRPFCTHDFMTGVPAVPGRELPVDVSVTGLSVNVMQSDVFVYLV